MEFFIVKYQVTQIDFDFDDQDNDLYEDKDHLISETLSHIWEATDEDNLFEEISWVTSWCIKSISFHQVIPTHSSNKVKQRGDV